MERPDEPLTDDELRWNTTNGWLQATLAHRRLQGVSVTMGIDWERGVISIRGDTERGERIAQASGVERRLPAVEELPRWAAS